MIQSREKHDLSDPVISDSFHETDKILNHKGFKNICVSISGGSDSDIVLDLCEKNAKTTGIRYLWIDTGMEFEATKEHLIYLEKRYHVQIDRRDAFLSIPDCCKSFGQPFLSKQVSDNMERLQQHGFQWEDEPFEILIQKYPRCDSAIRWWCNKKQGRKEDVTSHFEIAWNKGLKEFIMDNPPTFPISNKCCTYAKLKTTLVFHVENQTDLSICGVRKAEGGIRATSYKGTFSFNQQGSMHTFRPIYLYTDQSKKDYAKRFDICHSRCYTQYGMKRTGCAGCPLNRNIFSDLLVLKHDEPQLYRKALDIFGDSYEYTRRYRAFCKTIQ